MLDVRCCSGSSSLDDKRVKHSPISGSCTYRCTKRQGQGCATSPWMLPRREWYRLRYTPKIDENYLLDQATGGEEVPPEDKEEDWEEEDKRHEEEEEEELP